MDVLSKINWKKCLVFIFLLCLIAAGYFFFVKYYMQPHTAIRDARQSLTATGTIEAKTVIASFKAPGKLAGILVDEGAKVEAGQNIASLEAQEIRAELITAQGAYAAAVAGAQQASDNIALTTRQVETTIDQLQAKTLQADIGVKEALQNYERALELFENQVIPQKNLDDALNAYELALSKAAEAQSALDQAIASLTNVTLAESKYQAAQGTVLQTSGALQKAESYLNDTLLLSPASGYITAKYLETGEMVNSGTPVFEITDLDHPYINIYLSEKKIGRVQIGQTVLVTIDAYPEKTFSGRVVLINEAGEFAVQKAIDDQYEHDLRSFKVKINLDNTETVLRTGMTARVTIDENNIEAD